MTKYLIFAVCLWGIASAAPGQNATLPLNPQSDLPAEIQLPQNSVPRTNTIAPETAEKVEHKIREALDGNAPAETGDGVLDDVLGVIKSQGSILDGSILDDRTTNTDPGRRLTSRTRQSVDVDRRAVAAEQLLRAARLLLAADPTSESGVRLVAQMRREAVKLLSHTDD
ncbi:hypothetical protein Poly51_52130 [Rubripirellula tenax]|uniref:Secreted protein n=1 Tax=Rubripirellula tenax TaxID=2528015 RepID=A0A5C6EC97_9BACT|nr:hypothetical protein [Rubripirellula tenax]TWU47413.1 hypothetical protein Poly51_52130 [Rubripirellula tenax]